MKLHMPGRWLLEVKAKIGDKQDVLRIPYEQAPGSN